MNALRTISIQYNGFQSLNYIFTLFRMLRSWYLQQTVSSTILLLDYYLKRPSVSHWVYFGIIVISSSSVEVLIYNHNIPRYPPSRRRMHFFLFHRGVFEICLIIGFPYNNNNNNNTRGTVYIPVHRHIHVREENKIQNVPRSRARQSFSTTHEATDLNKYNVVVPIPRKPATHIDTAYTVCNMYILYSIRPNSSTL